MKRFDVWLMKSFHLEACGIAIISTPGDFMHFRILTEDASSKKTLDHILPKIVVDGHSFAVLSWKGIGRLPADLRTAPDPRKRTLLDKLPGLLRAAGKEFQSCDAVVLIVLDLDDRNAEAFLRELDAVLDSCEPRPVTFFCLAIEEGEAWLLGDRAAVETAYPKAKKAVLDSYLQDAICGTWEILADAVHPGGSAGLSKDKVAYSVIGKAKCEWSDRIAPYILPSRNRSPSFQNFVAQILALTTAAAQSRDFR
jgi:hypothetical protein